MASNVAIIDADLITRAKHRFPNLACMKISAYHKEKGNNVILKTDYNNLDSFDEVYISKVFTDTEVPEEVLLMNNVIYGGTGFFYDEAPALPFDIEHHMPDYHLYDLWVEEQLQQGKSRKEFEYYLDYSIGFTTRGCFRKCSFCVNKKYDRVYFHAPLEEFLDKSRKYICLLDDNILGYKNWETIFESLKVINKRFQYKQGLDIRLLTEEKAKVLSDAKYLGDYIFAFDDIKDKDIIEQKLKLWQTYCDRPTKLYVLCGYDIEEKYDTNFWITDLINAFERVYLLAKYNCKPYIMRFIKYNDSPFKGVYINLACWCNQPNIFKKMTFRQYSVGHGMSAKVYQRYKNRYEDYIRDGYKKGISWRYMENFEKLYPDIAEKYFDVRICEG